MEQVFSWRKAAIGSLGFHIVAAFCIGIIGWHMSQSMHEEAYEIDLSVDTAQSEAVHESTFAPPLKQEELTARVESALQSQVHTNQLTTSQATGGNSEPAGGTPTLASSDPMAAPAYGATPGAGTLAVAPGDCMGYGSGVGGDVDGAGTGTGGGTGTGDGVGSGSGENDGEGSGTGGGYFDGAGFWSAVNSNKAYPAQAVRRGIEGQVTVRAELDASGNLISAYVVSSSGSSILEQAAVRAVERATPYPNDSGEPQTIDVPLSFQLTE